MASSNLVKLFGEQAKENRSCETHGQYEARKIKIPGGEREIWTSCPVCSKEQIAKEDQALREQALQQQARSRAEAMLGRSAIPKRFIEKTLANFNAKTDAQLKALASVTRYAESWRANAKVGVNLILTGNPGTGKTHLAVGVAQHIMAEGGTAMYTRVIEVVRAVKETYGHNGRTERQVINSFREPDLLILDEVGRQYGSDTERMVMFDVINARYEDCKPTILIANLQANQLAEYIDPAALDRLREGGGRMVVFDWESQRSNI